MNIMIFLALAIVVIFSVAAIDKKKREIEKELKKWEDSESLPQVLRGGEIFLNEVNLRCKKPIPLHGRCDQVFKTKKKELVTVDTKTRKSARVYESDVIQLSAYRLMLKEKYGSQFKYPDYGYVRTCIVNEDLGIEKIKYIQVQLLDDKEMKSIYKKHQEIAMGKRKPVCSCGKTLHK